MRWGTICFDLDNTLFSHEDAFEKAICFCFHSILENKKYCESDIDIRQLFTIFKKYSDLFWDDYEKGLISPKEYRRKRFLHTIKQFDLPFNEKDADHFHEQYYNTVDDFSVPYPNLHQFIHKLMDAKIKVGIITNGNVDTQYNKITKLKLDHYISRDNIFISEEVKVWKPDRKIFDVAKEKLKSQGHYLFIGDSWEQDVVGSIEAGWDSIFLNTRKEKPKTTHKPIAISTSLEDVSEIIFKENRLKG